MAFPTNQETLDINILGTDSTSARDHAMQHNDVNRIVNALMNKMGINNSVDSTSHEWKINFLLSQLGFVVPPSTNIYTVGCIFDDPANDLPADISTQIDGVTVTNGMLVYVKNCLDGTKVGKIYQATVVGTAITWAYTYTPGTGDTINISGGNIYGGTTRVVNNNSIIVQYFGGTSGLRASPTSGGVDYELTIPGYTTYTENDVLLIAPNFNSGPNPNLNINALGDITVVAPAGLSVGQVYMIAYKAGQRTLVASGSGGGGGVQSVTGLDTDNTDPVNPVIQIAVGSGLSGDGTPANPLTTSDIGNNYLILSGTMAGTPPEVDITDTRITDVTPYLVFYNTQPVGNITRTLTNGNLNIASDDNADTLDVTVLFWNIGPAKQYMKGNETLTGAGPRVINDSRITDSTPAMLFPRTAPVGYLTATTGTGTLTIASTGTEVGVIVDYIITLDTTNYSDGMPYNATLDDDDMFFRKGAVSGDDEAVRWGDMKGNLGGFIAPTTPSFSFQNMPSIMQVLNSRVGGDCSTGAITRESIGYSDDVNYTTRYGRYGPSYGSIVLCNSFGVNFSTYSNFSGNIQYSFIYSGKIFRKLSTPIMEQCLVSNDISVGGNRSTTNFSGYTLDINDKPIGFSDGKLYLLRQGTSDIRRFVYDNVDTFTYVDTITTTLNTNGLIVNDKNYVCYTSGSAANDGRPQGATLIASVYDLNEVLLYTVGPRIIIDRRFGDKVYVATYQSEAAFCDAGGCGGLGGGFSSTGIRWIYQIA